MKVLATCSLGGSGHWLPLAGFLRAAMQPDDEVLVVAPPALRDMVEHDGFRFEMGAEPPEAEIAPIRERLPTEPPEVAAILGNRVLFAELAATAMLPHVDAACLRWRPDLLVRDPCEYAGAIVAGNRSIPSAQVGISQADVERRSLDVASPTLEQHRLGLTDEIASAPYLSRFPEVLDPSPFAATRRYRVPHAAAPERLPSWWEADDRPLVYVTFGTVLPYMSIATSAYRFVLDALASLDVRVLLTTGRNFPLDELRPLPPNAHVESWIDQDRVLREASVVVCHGGSGTMLGAVDASVPIVVVPFFSDQRANGVLVTRHRLGRVVEPTQSSRDRRPTFDADETRRLVGAVGELLDDPEVADGLSTVAVSWAATPSPAELLAGMRPRRPGVTRGV